VLLRLGAAPRDDTGVSCPELAFGRTFKLPGEFFESHNNINNASDYVSELQKSLAAVQPVEFKHKTQQKIFIHPGLWTTKRVYV